jgi:hypothetical protein
LAIGLVFVLVCANFGYYLHLYYYHYPLDSKRLWHAGLKEGMLRIAKDQDKYDKVIISNTYEPAMIFFLFWSQYDPSLFRDGDYQHFSTDWFEGKQIGKYYFGRLTSGFLDQASQSSQNNQSLLILAGRNDFCGDLNNQVPSPLQLVDKIYLPSKEPILFLLEKKPLNN